MYYPVNILDGGGLIDLHYEWEWCVTHRKSSYSQKDRFSLTTLTLFYEFYVIFVSFEDD